MDKNSTDKPTKQPVTIRLDSDLVAWFKSLEGKYQSNINQALREYMEATKDKQPIILNREDSKRFVEALNNPPELSQNLKDALALHTKNITSDVGE